MKAYVIVLAVGAVLLLNYGTPLSGERPARALRWESPDPILPMTFAHEDHVTENCVLCHHNYVDDTGGSPCMYCHVTDATVYPLLETQFHDLCRGCHEEKRIAGLAGGPTRVCVDCHLEEDAP